MSKNSKSTVKHPNRRNERASRRGGLLGLMFMLTDWFTKFFRKSFLGFILGDLYTKINEKWQSGFVYRFLRRENKRAHTHSSVISHYERSKTNASVASVADHIIHSKLKIWGARFFFFGFAMLIVSALKVFLVIEEFEITELWSYVLLANEEYNIALAAVIMLISMPFLASKREFGESMLAHKFTRFIITDVLNLNANKFEAGERSREVSYIATMLMAFSLGFTTFFMPPFIMISTMLLLVTFVVILSFPETGILMLLLSIPFATVLPHPNIFVLSLVVFTICGFVSKFVRGKRVLRIEFIDVLILLLGVLLMFGGVFTAGGSTSFKTSETFLAFLIMYFLIVNMYIRKPGIYRGMKIGVVTGFLVALIGVVYVLLTSGWLSFEWIKLEPVQYILEGAGKILVDKNALGIYLVMIYPLALGQMLVTDKKFKKLLYIIAILTIMASIILTFDKVAALGLALATLIFMLIYNFKSIWLALGMVCACFAVYAFLPLDIKSYIASLLNAGDKLDVWSKVFEIIKDNIFTGIGVGEDAFLAAFYNQSVIDEPLVTNAGNLFLRIWLELGIVGLLLFALVLFTFAQKCFINTKRTHIRSRSRTMICAGYASIFTACLMGLNENIWSNYRSFLTFWIILALTVALTKVNDRERESERVLNNMTRVDMEID